MVIGELAMGNLKPRETVLHSLALLPQVIVARHEETIAFIHAHKLYGLGIGYIDAHLLASTQLTAHTRIWTGDRRLKDVAQRLVLFTSDHGYAPCGLRTNPVS
jgi:predicted nucleic acid-binding protein